MKKRHKMRVVAGLEARGMFMLRDAVDTIAAALKVTRYTIYNYLNEIAADRGAAPVRAATRSRTRQQDH
ncbi:MAG: helix-turn-helix domain-containing protein [Jatrophihabitans sp.]